jgi:hypothetical protein
MAVYHYLFQELLTGQILGEMPINGVSFDRQLNRAGNMQGSVNLDNDLVPNDDVLAMTEKGRNAIYVYRGDVIVWGGIIWTRTYQSQGKSLQFTAQSFESYAYRRIYRPNSARRYNEAQCNIIRKFWDLIQQDPNGAIGVDFDVAIPAVDVSRQINVFPWTFKSFGELIETYITDQTDGADYYIDVFEDEGLPSKRLVLGYPRVGASLKKTDLLIEYPGNVLNYYWTENASETNLRYYATGDGDESAMLVGIATDTTRLGNNYLITDASNSYQGVTSQSTINAHAAADLKNGGINKVKHQFTLKADEDPQLGQYSLGDDARVRIQDTRFPLGYDFSVRVVGWSVTPSSSESTEEVSLVLEGEEDALA